MWNWINVNSAAIQAVAAVVTGLATIVLVIITSRYVRLTKALADAANAQLNAQLQVASARRRELLSCARRLFTALESLPATRTSDAAARLQDSIPWDDFDFSHFRELASEVSPVAGQCAAIVESNMNLIAPIVREVKTTAPAIGYNWANFPWARWSKAVDIATEAVMSICREVEGPSGGQDDRRSTK